MLQDPKKIFDAKNETILQLIGERNWQNLIMRNKIARILNFMKNEIVFGFNSKPCLAASQVLAEGCGQALTKSILLKTLLDACDVLCRFHAFTVKKSLYKGLARPINYNILPETLISTWVEVFYEGQWLVADGILLDAAYVESLQEQIRQAEHEFIGMGSAVFISGNSYTEWNGKNHTYCQRAAITRDIGIVEDFDWFFSEFRPDFRQLKKISPKYANRIIQTRRYPQ